MKVAMLHWAFPPTIGGVESHLAMLCPALVRKGHRVYLLTGAVDGKVSEEMWDGVFVRRTPLMDLNSLTPALIRRHRSEIREELAKFIVAVNPDVIHVHNMHYFSLVHAEAVIEVKNRAKIPVILTAHNVWDDADWEEFLSIRREWDGVIAVSGYIKKKLAASGYLAEKIAVIHHGIDLVRFSSIRPNEEVLRAIREAAGERKVIFHPARMSLAKGSDIAVLAFKQVKEAFPETFLLLAGTEKTVDWGAYQQGEISQIKSLIAELDLGNSTLIRFFPWGEMPSAYWNSDVVIYPSSFDEPFGLVLLEAMAAAKPLIVTRVGGMPEVVKEGETGFVIPPRRPNVLAEKILELLRNPGLCQVMGQKALFTLKRRFTLERMVTATLNYYEKVSAEANWMLERRTVS